MKKKQLFTAQEVFNAVEKARDNRDKYLYDSDDPISFGIGAATVLKYLD